MNQLSSDEARKIVKDELIKAMEAAYNQLVSIVGSDNEDWLQDHFDDYVALGIIDFEKYLEA